MRPDARSSPAAHVESLGAGRTAPVATLHAGKPQKPLPITVKSKGRLTVLFDVTIDCAVLGDPDSRPVDDLCPRSVTPPYVVDPYPNGEIRDKGCGATKPDKTRGGDVLIDVKLP